MTFAITEAELASQKPRKQQGARCPEIDVLALQNRNQLRLGDCDLGELLKKCCRRQQHVSVFSNGFAVTAGYAAPVA